MAEAQPSRVVPKPVPEREAKDARGYQLEQMRRRFSPKETELGNGDVSLLFNLAPSDPDFPFDLAHLECDLLVPAGYPQHQPRLQVKNKDIPRGFAINIEKGWDKLVQEKHGATLLALTKALDRNLESLLSEQKAETVKMTIFKDTRHLEAGSREPTPQPLAPATKPAARPYIPEISYTQAEISEAKARRAQEVRQLEVRMRHLPIYQKSSDGVIYTLSLEPKCRNDLPSSLRDVQSLQLIIPLLYPLQPLRVILDNVPAEDAEPVEELFAQKAAEQKKLSLMGHLSYLTQRLHLLVKEAMKPAPEAAPAPESPAGTGETEGAERAAALETGKGHAYVIPRPPEWSQGAGSESDSDSYDSDSDEDGGAAIGDDDDAEPAAGPSMPTQTAELGTAILFPSVELHGVELLQIAVLSLNVKCNRCKTINEVTGLKDGLEKASSCKKCATPFTIRFRPELVHQNSTRAGFVDATGCTVADLLPRYAPSTP